MSMSTKLFFALSMILSSVHIANLHGMNRKRTRGSEIRETKTQETQTEETGVSENQREESSEKTILIMVWMKLNNIELKPFQTRIQTKKYIETEGHGPIFNNINNLIAGYLSTCGVINNNQQISFNNKSDEIFLKDRDTQIIRIFFDYSFEASTGAIISTINLPALQTIVLLQCRSTVSAL